MLPLSNNCGSWWVLNLFQVVPALAKEPTLLDCFLHAFVYFPLLPVTAFLPNSFWQESDRRHEGERCRERVKSEKKDRHRSRSRSHERDYTHSKQKDKYKEDSRVRDWDRKASRSPKKSKDKERSKYRWKMRRELNYVVFPAFSQVDMQLLDKSSCLLLAARPWNSMNAQCVRKPWFQKGVLNKVFHVSEMVWVSNKECCVKLLGNTGMQ